MKILFYFGHPAQYLFARDSIKKLILEKHEIKIIIKTKDVLEKLLQNDGFEYENILTRERGLSLFSIIWSLIRRNIALLPIILRFKPHLLIGTDASIAQIGFLLKINRITILEDDYDIIKSFAIVTYPFTQTILCPDICSVGKWEDKKIGYCGYMKLAYLHPDIFKFRQNIIEQYTLYSKYILIRLVRLTAYHDFGIRGIDMKLLDKIIIFLETNNYQFYITTEDEIDQKYHQYLLKINPTHMHHILSRASILISDSQSMSVEASMLGIPSLRVSSFVGKISVLEELEYKYGLTFGIDPNDIEKLFKKIKYLLSKKDLKKEFEIKRETMINDKIQVSHFLTWFISHYPKSKEIMQKDSSYQEKFKG